MLTKILNNIREFCSLKVPQGASQNKWKGGFTLIELMVVIIIVNLLSGVAVPKLTDYIERTKQKIDLLHLYYLRDAVNRALYEDDVHNMKEGKQGQDCPAISNSDLNKWLTDQKGVTYFIMELNESMPMSYQGTHSTMSNHNMCGLMYSAGFWSTALKEGGFGAVADIVADRDAHKNYANYKPTTYTAVKNTADTEHTYYRTYPNTPIFRSRFMTVDKAATGKDNTRIAMKMIWTNLDSNSHSLEVFLGGQHDTYRKALLSRQGICFSTMGPAGCRESRASR
ncbi:type II secretion system protein [Fibrobacter sp. UWB5]|uniref:type II secretion system protein n=1 Tax=Fibrobacter sp. UWB5 TaxID=1964360 RepID=UPI000B52835B|nr:prepilin-type N-terminal cleavage/methylation domain-containing protein [Fibrobacter sp. UWB5]OWV14340.1 hypothetical protein B7989_02470 [Fibrobacter sp. UWB5]